MHIKVETQDQVTQSFDHLELPLGNWYTTEEPLSLDIGGGKLTVELACIADAEGRPTYRYAIHDKNGRLLETSADLDGTDQPDSKAAMELLVDYLGKAAKALGDEISPARSRNLELFGWETTEWAHQNAEALEMAQLEIGFSSLTGALEL